MPRPKTLIVKKLFSDEDFDNLKMISIIEKFPFSEKDKKTLSKISYDIKDTSDGYKYELGGKYIKQFFAQKYVD